MATKAEARLEVSPVVARKILREEVDRLNGFTPRVQRLKRKWMDTISMVSSDRGYYYMESWKLTEGEHESVRVAKMFRNYCEKCRIDIRDDELLVGGITHWARGSQPRPESKPEPLLCRLQEQEEKLHTVSLAVAASIEEYDLKRLTEACEFFRDYFETLENRPRGSEPLWLFKERRECRRVPIPTEYDKARRLAFMAMPFQPDEPGSIQGLPSPSLCLGCNYEKLLSKGVSGIIAEVEERIKRIKTKPRKDITPDDLEAIEVLRSWIIALEGMVTYSRRHAALAREKAATEKDLQRRRELLRIADVCENVPANPARDFQEALQTHWFVTLLQEIEKSYSNAVLGRLDQYCYPYYVKSINEGIYTRQECAELVGCLFMKWQSLESFTCWVFQRMVPGSYIANLNVGGIDRFGKDASNELSTLILHVAMQVKTNQPHISLLYHRALAPEFVDKAIECTREHGGGIPAWFNQRVVLDFLLDRGIPLEEARHNGCIVGCVDIGTQNSYIWDRYGGVGFVNHAKLLELALNNGVDPFTGFQLGPDTGDPRDFKTFENLEEAYRYQVDYFAEYELSKYAGMTKEQYWEDHAYAPFSSPLNDGCVERAKELHKGGMLYFDALCGGYWIDRSQSDACDSLLAMKKVVFDDKLATMDEVLQALKDDFVGHEELRKKLMEGPAYGNDDDEADEFMCKWWNYTKEQTKYYRDFKGLRMCPHRNGNGWGSLSGMVTGALPDGRKAGMPLVDAAVSPRQGADRKGPTAMLNSAAKLDPENCNAPLLNMRFTPGPLKTKQGMKKFEQLLATYFDKGAAHVQFTILNRETLKDAKEHPENYRDLVVRVAGYSAFWVELTPEVQNEIISRSEHDL